MKITTVQTGSPLISLYMASHSCCTSCRLRSFRSLVVWISLWPLSDLLYRSNCLCGKQSAVCTLVFAQLCIVGNRHRGEHKKPTQSSGKRISCCAYIAILELVCFSSCQKKSAEQSYTHKHTHTMTTIVCLRGFALQGNIHIKYQW